VNLIQKIKEYFYNSSLKSALKSNAGVQREMININSAKRIGIIFNATKKNDIITVTQFADKLRNEGKEVYTLGYQDRKLKEEAVARLFDRNSIDWFGIPNDTKVDSFQKLNLDILICAFEEECLPLEYIVATSKARFRVGAFSKAKTNYYELMINIKKDQQLLYLLKQIKHFLKVINKND
jgi:ABC-type uncharacterized transport system substrate-binding protein